MSDDDQDIYDDIDSVTKPSVAEKPNVKQFTKLFEQPGGNKSIPVQTRPVSEAKKTEKPNNTANSTNTNTSNETKPPDVVKKPVPTPAPKKISTGLKPLANGLDKKKDSQDDKISPVSPSGSDVPKVSPKPTGNKKVTIPAAFSDSSDTQSKTVKPPPVTSKKPLKTVTINELQNKINLTNNNANNNNNVENKENVHKSSTGAIFRKLDKPIFNTMSKCPAKPEKLSCKLDFSKVIAELKNKGSDADDIPNDDDQELYDDVAAPVKRPKQEPVVRPVSLIPEFTEEEEEEFQQDLYDDAFTPALPPPPSAALLNSLSSPSSSSQDSGVGSTAGTDIIPDDEVSEVYEPLDELTESVQELKKEEEKDKKEQEKREREEKKKEKERQKKLEKDRKSLQKFKINGTEPHLMEGEIRENAKGGKLDLPVTEGETVYIIRMTDNPPGKFLVKNTDIKYGYVDSSNIEIHQSTKEQVKRSITDDQFYDDTADGDECLYEES